MRWRALCLHQLPRRAACRPVEDKILATLSRRRYSAVKGPNSKAENPTSPDGDKPDPTPASDASSEESNPIDPSIGQLGRIIRDDFANFKDHYSKPQHPIVLAHGLLGFDELRLAPSAYLPPIHYWRGIKEAFARNGIEVVSTSVPTTGSIAARAAALHAQIKSKLPGRTVNIVAHSMGGLDARFLVSRLCPSPTADYTVASLTTVATPHRGSSAADMLLRDIGDDALARMHRLLARIGVSTDAFAQLTTAHVREHFNPRTPNDPAVRYFSYGASATPHLLSVFRLSHDLMQVVEGPNDGLVSVASSRWGCYRGTLMGVTHLDLINWTNRVKRAAGRVGVVRVDFDAVAFYLGIADMLAREGL